MALFSDFVSKLGPQNTGKQFEKFVKWFLKNDPEWKTQVDEIWLFGESDNPYRWRADNGTDLIFRHVNGEVWAVLALS